MLALTFIQFFRLPDLDQFDRIDLRRRHRQVYFCEDGKCYRVIGGVVVYFDGSHISATYARTLAPYMAGPLEKALAS